MSDDRQITEPVIGLRQFKVDKNGRLTGIVIEEPWHPGHNEAKCIKPFLFQPCVIRLTGWRIHIERHGKKAPVNRCSCGIYAYHENRENIHNDSNVWAVIRGWGHIEVHPDGWRSQYGELLALYNTAKLDVFKLAHDYNVPVLPAKYSPQLLEQEFGPFVPEDMRPEQELETSPPYLVADYVLWAVAGTAVLSTVIKVLRWTHRLLSR